MSRLNHKLGFIVTSMGPDSRPVARFSCRCGSTFDQALISGSSMNPEFIAKRARAAGWLADASKASSAMCPTCQDERRKKRAGESPKLALVMPAALVAAASPPVAEPPVVETIVETPEMSVVAVERPAPTNTEALPRDATIDQKVKIRTLLDKHFDDLAGHYLDGYSDQRIGHEVDVPWGIVAKIRDAGWGPIRANPEFAAIRKDLKDLSDKVEAAAKVATEAQKIVSDLQASGLAIHQRLIALEGKKA